jgi:hypothetical protein
MPGHGFLAQEQLPGDGAIVHPRGDQAEHLAFASRQARRSRRITWPEQEIGGGTQLFEHQACSVQFHVRAVPVAKGAAGDSDMDLDPRGLVRHVEATPNCPRTA